MTATSLHVSQICEILLSRSEQNQNRILHVLIMPHFSKGVVRSLASELGPVQYIAALIAGCTISADFRKLQTVAGMMVIYICVIVQQ